MVSIDVVSLHTSVPRQESVRERLERDSTSIDSTILGVDKIMELIDLCLDSTYFQLGDKFYEQRRGLAMGSPLSPVLVDLYMETIKANIKVQDTGNHFMFWKRYVDDIFAIISREGDPEAIIAQANTILDTVKFTLEKEREGSLAFLDVKITKNEENW
jgi:hypothetical protein